MAGEEGTQAGISDTLCLSISVCVFSVVDRWLGSLSIIQSHPSSPLVDMGMTQTGPHCTT